MLWWQARGMDARLMEYVPPDILTATDGLDLDLDLNELMVRARSPVGFWKQRSPLCAVCVLHMCSYLRMCIQKWTFLSLLFHASRMQVYLGLHVTHARPCRSSCRPSTRPWPSRARRPRALPATKRLHLRRWPLPLRFPQLRVSQNISAYGLPVWFLACAQMCSAGDTPVPANDAAARTQDGCSR